jgi:UrcA family protein
MQDRAVTRIGLALVIGAAGLVLASTAASAQGYGPYDEAPYATNPSEEVEVIAPRYRSESSPLNGPMEKVSLSTAVPYGDLDLRTRHGARELRVRVVDAARGVCGQLADAYPVYELNGTSCYKTAVQNGLLKANAAISDARLSYLYGYSD